MLLGADPGGPTEYAEPVARSAIVALALAVAMVTLAASTSASAQPRRPTSAPTDNEVAEARALFMAAQAAVEAGRWADAVDSFSRAYTLTGAASALFNLAYAYRALGRHLEARDTFEALLIDHPDFDTLRRAEAERLRDEVAARITVLSVAGLAPDVDYVVRLDGTRVDDTGARPLELEADPGEHRLTVRGPQDIEAFDWEDVLDDGDQVTVDYEAQTERPSGGGGILSSPVFWTVLGVVLVGAGVGLGVGLGGDEHISPMSDRRFTL